MVVPLPDFDRSAPSQLRYTDTVNGAGQAPGASGPTTDTAPVSGTSGAASPTPVGFPLSAAFLILAAAEFAMVVATAILVKVVYLDLVLDSGPPSSGYIGIALLLGGVLHLIYKQMGLYDLESLAGPEIGYGKLLGGLATALLIVLGLLYAIKEVAGLSRGWVFIWVGLVAILILPLRAAMVHRVRRGMATGLLLQRIAIIGTKEFAPFIAERIRTADGLTGAIDLYHCQPTAKDFRFVGGWTELEQAMAVRPYDRVIVAIPARDVDAIRSTVKSLGAYTTELLLCSDLTRMPIATSGARQLAGIRVDVIHPLPRSEQSLLLKRALDLIIAVPTLLALLPLFLLIAIAIKLDSSGPVFFRQRRLGKNSSVFWIYKFRSMTVVEDGPVVVQAIRNDLRVTRIGRILRSTSIDELPQLINVVLGDMSLVGPRPHAIAHDTEFDQNFELFSRRRRVAPGITGWAQVHGYRGETRTPEDVRSRMDHDLYYIDHWSIWLDIEILARTLFVVAKGAY